MRLDAGQVELKVGSWCGRLTCPTGLWMRSEEGAEASRRAAGGLKAGLGKGLHAEAREELSAFHGRASVSQRWPPAAHRPARTQHRKHTGSTSDSNGSPGALGKREHDQRCLLPVVLGRRESITLSGWRKEVASPRHHLPRVRSTDMRQGGHF
ncbi:hypothetical protein IRJ41_016393 [Triplophysa rosa]|uniref:Uncharacterized protein n=1 Tax=Triplophysa rosa TaxID=992332 RepID=A0A9W7WWU6_TRIRA|nr:hypothetical protein IRJ41_016393 [Triplophysa rosa]